ncbi:Pentatricopeptide repeat-containing protein [Platanthera guangdongensis]|uniref:Pentatricopeptide repeat-containing protein n=1 Tax=Platanthera guangdongensis TaxID=2320717 RepID=A0ABR2LN13_9ASPA
MLCRLNPAVYSFFISRLCSLSVRRGDDHRRQQPQWIAANHIFQRNPRLLSLQHCDSLHRLHPILAYAIVSGLFSNPFVASRILHSSVTISPHDLSLSFSLFSQMIRPNHFSWNAMIKSLAATTSASSAAALSLFVEMRRRDILPDKYTLPFLLMSFNSTDDLHNGRSIHTLSFVLGCESNLFLQTGLVSMYIDCGSVDYALQLFDEMQIRDVVTWTAVISGLARQGCYEQALAVLNDMRTDDSNPKPNLATMVSSMSACSSIGSLIHTKNLHAYLVKTGFNIHIFARNSLIHCYAKSGSITCACQLFDEMAEKDLHSWTAVIMGLALNGLSQDAIFLFSEMLRTGLQPDSTTFVAVLSACSHAGLVDVGIKLLESMEEEFGIRPELKHYGCVVDIFARAGQLSRAYEFIRTMPMQPNLETLGALLSASSVHGDLELGELLSRRIESLTHACSQGASIILSNMYANNGQWEKVISIRRGRRQEGCKPPGRSWIVVRGNVEEFVVGDRVHPFSKEIGFILDELDKMKDGFV